jgi:hypothetical protein
MATYQIINLQTGEFKTVSLDEAAVTRVTPVTAIPLFRCPYSSKSARRNSRRIWRKALRP